MKLCFDRYSLALCLRSLCCFNMKERSKAKWSFLRKQLSDYNWHMMFYPSIKRTQFWPFLSSKFNNIELSMSISFSLMFCLYITAIFLSNSYWFPTEMCFVFLISLIFHECPNISTFL